MKRLSLAAALLAAFGTIAYAQTQQELLRDGSGGNTDNVLTYGMGYHQQRYSPLKQIDQSNVSRLGLAWSVEVGSDGKLETTPVVFNGVLYGTSALLEAMPPYQSGGDMIRSVSFERTQYDDPPHRFEAGTPDVAGAVGLAAAIGYLAGIGFERIVRLDERAECDDVRPCRRGEDQSSEDRARGPDGAR